MAWHSSNALATSPASRHAPRHLRPALADADIAIRAPAATGRCLRPCTTPARRDPAWAGVDLIPVAEATRHGIVGRECAGRELEHRRRVLRRADVESQPRLIRIDSTARTKGGRSLVRWASARAICPARRPVCGSRAIIGGRLAKSFHGAFRMTVLRSPAPPRRAAAYVTGCSMHDSLRRAISSSSRVRSPARPRARRSRAARGVKPRLCHQRVARRGHRRRCAHRRAACGASWGAALDVFVEQPLPRIILLQLGRIVLLNPHLARRASDGFDARHQHPRGRAGVADLAGEKPRHFYNPEVWERARARRR